jgi:hypothetical protein
MSEKNKKKIWRVLRCPPGNILDSNNQPKTCYWDGGWTGGDVQMARSWGEVQFHPFGAIKLGGGKKIK